MTEVPSPDAQPNAGESDLPKAGARFADYELLEEIGRGGMGVIYRARQRGTNRIVAVKMMLPGLAGTAQLRERFRREAEAAASLDHPGILRVYEVGDDGALPFFAMRFAEGGSLADGVSLLRGNPRASVTLVAKIARAIHYAHQRGLLHRDLKPANVLLDAANEPMVTDFGLVRWVYDARELTRSMVVLGTAGYVAPEQASGLGALTPGVDIYSIGVILFELLAGGRPFAGENALGILRRAAEEPPPRLREHDPDLPRELELICERCMQADPALRYLSALDVAEDLECWLVGKKPTNHQLPVRTRARQWLRRNPRIALAGVGVMLVLAGMAVAALAPSTSPHETDGTTNLEAAHFFRRGVEVYRRQRNATGSGQAVELLQRAISLDPTYALAHAELSRIHSDAYWSYLDRSEERATKAKESAETALRLRPELARSQLALAEYYFRCRRDDQRALSLIRRARNLDPRDTDAYGLLATVAKRRHEWQEAIDSGRRICELEPNSTACLYDLGVTFEVLRRYPEAAETFERAAYLAPERPTYVAKLGWVQFRENGDLSGLAEFNRRIPSDRASDEDNFEAIFAYLMLSRDFDGASRLLYAVPDDFVVRDSSTFWPKAFLRGQVEGARGDQVAAKRELESATRMLRAWIAEHRDDGRAKSSLARACAMLGQTDEAIREAREAVALVSMEREPVDGPERVVDLAEVLLRAGEADEARALIAHLLNEPGYLTISDLRMNARWDFARGDAQFAALLASSRK